MQLCRRLPRRDGIAELGRRERFSRGAAQAARDRRRGERARHPRSAQRKIPHGSQQRSCGQGAWKTLGPLTWVEVEAAGHMVPLNNGAAGFWAIDTLVRPGG